MNIIYYFMPVVGSLIGWGTNVIAIKLLFRPYKEKRIPLIGMSIQGLLPKRQKDIAKNIGFVVEAELLNSEDIFNNILTPESIDKLTAMITRAIQDRISQHLPGYIPESIRTGIYNGIEKFLYREIKRMINELKYQVRNDMINKIDVAHLIEERINGFNATHIENLALQVARRELRHIEILGALIGFIVGTLQMVFAIFI